LSLSHTFQKSTAQSQAAADGATIAIRLHFRPHYHSSLWRLDEDEDEDEGGGGGASALRSEVRSLMSEKNAARASPQRCGCKALTGCMKRLSEHNACYVSQKTTDTGSWDDRPVKPVHEFTLPVALCAQREPLIAKQQSAVDRGSRQLGKPVRIT